MKKKRQRVDFSANIKVEMKPVKKDKRVAYGKKLYDIFILWTEKKS